VINQFRPAFRRLRDTLQDLRPPRDTGHGFRFVGSQKRFRGSADELGTIELLRLLAPRLQGFLNVGANAGFYCLLAESLGLDCLAFEPEPRAFRLLQRNLALNQAACVPIPVALSSQRGRASFFGTGTAGSLLAGISGTPSWDRQTVTTLPLDTLFEPGGVNPQPTNSLWLLDCEGAEPEVLSGAQRTLAAVHPLLTLEWQPGRHSDAWARCIEQLLGIGYTHLLACSSLVGSGPIKVRILAAEALDDQVFLDNVLVMALEHHRAFLDLLPPLPPL